MATRVVALTFLLGCILATGAVAAEPLTLQGAVDLAFRANTDYQTAVLAVDRARSSLVDPVNWKGVGLTATQKQTSAATAPGASSTPSTTTFGLTLPLLDQLGASATVDQDKNAQVSVNLTPLAHSDTAAQARFAYDKAVLAESQARASLETSVRRAWLAQVLAQAKVDAQVRQTALKKTAYDDARARLDKAQVTLSEVRTALKDWTDAQGSLSSLQRTLLQAQTALGSLLGTGTQGLQPVGAEDLRQLVEALGPVDGTSATGAAAVRTQALEVQSQKAKADAIWALDPGLTVNASASVPNGGTVSWSASATLTLALGSWKGSDRALADRSLELAQRTLAAKQTESLAAQAQGLLAVQAAASTVESRTLARTQAQELLTETSILVKAGKATALELEEAQLGVLGAENDLFSAWADLYGARLDLIAARS